MNKNLENRMNELADDFTQEASGDLFNLEKQTGVGWGSDEAVCHIIEGSFQAGFNACHDLMLEDMKKLVGALEQTIQGISSFDFEDRAKEWATFAPDRQAQHFYEGALMTRTIIREAHKKALQEYKSKWGEG